MGEAATRQKGIDTGLGALDTFLQRGDPFHLVENLASDEAERRMYRLKHRYSEWLDLHYPVIEAATAKLEDNLFQAGMHLASDVEKLEFDFLR